VSAKSGRTQFVILCEDRNHYNFARGFLVTRLGDQHVEFVQKISPHGKGAGEQWVREAFVEELESLKRSASRRKVALLALIDGDNLGCAARKANLLSYASGGDFDALLANHVAIFSPTRNIETWFYWIDGHEGLDEKTDYKNHYRDVRATKKGKELGLICKGGAGGRDFPPSLLDGCREWKRVDARG
jgi:hypothetical protein